MKRDGVNTVPDVKERYEHSPDVDAAYEAMDRARVSANWADSTTRLRPSERRGSGGGEAYRYEVQPNVVAWVAYRTDVLYHAVCESESQLVAGMDAYQIMRSFGEGRDGVDFSASQRIDPIGVFGAVYGLLAPELRAELEEVESDAEQTLDDLASRIGSLAVPEDVLNEVNLKRMLLALIRNGEAFSVIALSYYHIVQAFAGTPGDDMFSNTAAFIEDLFKRTRDEDRVSLRRLRRSVRFADQMEDHSDDDPFLWDLVDEYIRDINCDRSEGLTPDKVSALRKAFGSIGRLSDGEKEKVEKIIAELEKKYPAPKLPTRKEKWSARIKGVVTTIGKKMKRKKTEPEPELEPEPESYSGDLVRTAVALARMRWMVMSQIGIAASPVFVGLPMACLALEAVAESSLVGLGRVAGVLWNGVGLPGYECFRIRGINNDADRQIQELMNEMVSYSRGLSSEIIGAATDLDNGWGWDADGFVKSMKYIAPTSGRLIAVDIHRQGLDCCSDIITCSVNICIVDKSDGATIGSCSVDLHIPVDTDQGFIGKVSNNHPVLMGGRSLFVSAYRDARSGDDGECGDGGTGQMVDAVRVRRQHREQWRIYFNQISVMYRSGEITDQEYIVVCNDYAEVCRTYTSSVGKVNRRLDSLILRDLGRHRGTCVNAFYCSLVEVVYPSLGRLQRIDENEQSRWLNIAEHNQLIMIGLSFLSDILDSPNSRFLAARMNNVSVYNFLDEFSGNADVQAAILQTLSSLGMFIGRGGLENRAAFLENVISMAEILFRAYNGKALPQSVVPKSTLPRPKDPASGDFTFKAYCRWHCGSVTNARRIASDLMNVENAGRDLAGRVNERSGPIPAPSQILRAFRRL